MTGLPTLTVKLDDGTGTFPYDVSEFVRLPDGVTVTRGRQDELNDVSPSSLSLTFDNTTGVFTLGSGTYGIAIDQQIQVTENVTGAVKRFTGYVEDWPVAWPDGSDQFAVAQITAVDRLARLARRKLLPMITYEILADAPQWYWPCTESKGASAAGDLSGNNGPNMRASSANDVQPVPPNMGGGNLGFDGFTAPTLASANQQYLGPATPLTLATAATSFTFEFAFATTTVATNNPLARIGLATSGVKEWNLNSAGQIELPLSGFVGSTNLADGSTHHFVYTYTGGVATVYIDGVAVLTPTITDAGGTTPTFLLGNAGTLGTFDGAIGQAAFYTSALSPTRILAHANALRNGFDTDTADTRITRLAADANIATADLALETGAQPSIAGQATGDQSTIDAMQAVALAEGGLVFIRGDGKLVMQNKEHRVIRATGTAALTLTADQVDPGVAPGGAKNYLVNTATAASVTGATQRMVNAASVSAYEEYSSDLSRALLPSDELVLYLLQWTTTLYGTPRPRIGALTIDLLTTASSTTVQNILNLEIGDLITVSGLPSQTPASLGNLLVEGWTENLTHDSWTITLNTVPAALFSAPIVDQASATCDTGYPVYF